MEGSTHIPAWWGGIRWGLTGDPVSQGYRPGRGAYEPDHTGIDIAGPYGFPVVADLAGRIENMQNPGGFGNYVILHPRDFPGYELIFGHLSGYARADQSQVNPGDVIGYEGSTGWSTGPHVHLQVNAGPPDYGYGGTDIDPSGILAMHGGGIVPGPVGKEVLIRMQGGEHVTPITPGASSPAQPFPAEGLDLLRSIASLLRLIADEPSTVSSWAGQRRYATS